MQGRWPFFNSPFQDMKDKLSEFKNMMQGQKDREDGEIPVVSDDAAAEVSESPGEENSWQQKYEEAMQASQIQKDLYLRQAAEFENMRKRLRKEFDDNIKFASERIVKDLIPVLDNLEMTVSHVPADKASDPVVEGIRLTLKQFSTVLLQNGVEEIAGEGNAFDPNIQEAIGTDTESSLPSGHVTKVHRKGYLLNGRLIRAALVTVRS